MKGETRSGLFALLLARGLRRHELAGLTARHLQQREGHSPIVDLREKAGYVRTTPVPDWVYGLSDERATVVEATPVSAAPPAGELEQIQFLSATSPCRPALRVTPAAPSGFHCGE